MGTQVRQPVFLGSKEGFVCCMNAKSDRFDEFVEGLWRFFASVRLTVFILLSLATTSVIGTLIPQNEAPAAYFEAYGANLYRLFAVFDLFDMYHSLWFQMLLLLLVINIVVCSIDRLTAVWKIIFVKTPRFSPARFQKEKGRIEFSIPDAFNDEAALTAACDKTVRRRFGYLRTEKNDDATGFYLFAEKGRWSRLGVYGVHVSVVLLVLGGLIGSLFGFEGFVNIPEGEATDTIRIRNSGRMARLDFTIRCDDFHVSFYESGAPEEFRSSLTILEDGREVLKKEIIVNDPLRYRGINIFQASYGEMRGGQSPPVATAPTSPPDEIVVAFTSSQSGMTYERTLVMDQPFALPEGLGEFRLTAYTPTTDFGGQDLGAAYTAVLTPAEGQPLEVLLPVRFPNFDKMRKGEVVIAIVGAEKSTFTPRPQGEKRYYTGLQVTNDPGVWVVYAGFIMMIIGCYITFFMSHRRLCVAVARRGGKLRFLVAGHANKNKFGMQRLVDQFAANLKQRCSHE